MQITGGGTEEGGVTAEVKRVDGADKTLYLPAAECIRQRVSVGTQYPGLHTRFHIQSKPGQRKITKIQ